MTGKGEKVTAERFHVDCEMRHRLGGIDEHDGALLFGESGHCHNRMDGAKGIRDPAESEDFGALVEQGLEGVLIEHAVIIAGDDFENRTSAFAGHLPWDDVRVVFEGRDENFIARLESCAQAVGGEVDRVGAAASENQLIRIGATEVGGDRFSGSFIGCSRGAGEGVGAAVDVGIDGFVVGARGIEDGEWFLGGGGIVQIDQGLAVDLLVQNGKLFARWQEMTHAQSMPWFFRFSTLFLHEIFDF